MSSRQSYDIQTVLREMREDYWRGIGEAGEVAAPTRDYLVFRLAGELFGLPTAVAREVLRLPKLVRVPRVSEVILGIVNLRGEIVAVTDLRPLFGLRGQELPADARLVVTEAAGVTSALLTERVEGIRAVSIDAIEPLTAGLGRLPREVVAGQVALDGGYLILLEMGALMARPELMVDSHGE